MIPMETQLLLNIKISEERRRLLEQNKKRAQDMLKNVLRSIEANSSVAQIVKKEIEE